MKISQLPKINKIRRDIEIPLAVQGENLSVTMGQIIDAASQNVVAFNTIRESHDNVQIVDGNSTIKVGNVIFDTITNKFYLFMSLVHNVAGQSVTERTYYKDWSTHDNYYDADGNVRKDCLFRASSGRLYFFDGTTLKSAGITDEQAVQIRHAAPIEVASLEEMENRIEAGEYEEGQLYFLAE